MVAATEVDHIQPLFKGGADAWENMQSLCHDHHAIKTDRDMDRISKAGADESGWPHDESHPWNSGG